MGLRGLLARVVVACWMSLLVHRVCPCALGLLFVIAKCVACLVIVVVCGWGGFRLASCVSGGLGMRSPVFGVSYGVV